MKLSDSKTPGLFSTYSYSLRQILTEKLCTPFEYPKVKLEIKLNLNISHPFHCFHEI